MARGVAVTHKHASRRRFDSFLLHHRIAAD
jgi:hypothetical protein